MLDSLKFWNSQIHEVMDLPLVAGVTTLIGETNAGKSTCLRTLRWVCLNKPEGDGLRRKGSRFTKARLQFDGHTLIRTKGKKNTYRLDGETFTAIGRGVPDEIAALLNLSEENFAGQHEPHFWLALSPGQVSRELNAVINLDVIDSALSNVSNDLRKAKTEVEVTQDRVRAAESQLESLSWVEDADRKLRKLEGLEKEQRELEERAEALEAFLGEGEALGTALRGAVEAQKRARKAVRAVEAYQAAELEADALAGLLGALEAAQEDCLAKRKAAEAAQEEWEGVMKGACPLCGRS